MKTLTVTDSLRLLKRELKEDIAVISTYQLLENTLGKHAGFF